jgi:hypothetical protein
LCSNDCVGAKINSSKELSKIDKYPSKSDLGFWKLYTTESSSDIIITNNDCTVFKGNDDYIAESFIHLKLQNFININFYKIKRIIQNYRINPKTIRRAYSNRLKTINNRELLKELPKELLEELLKELPVFPTTSGCGKRENNNSSELQSIS